MSDGSGRSRTHSTNGTFALPRAAAPRGPAASVIEHAGRPGSPVIGRPPCLPDPAFGGTSAGGVPARSGTPSAIGGHRPDRRFGTYSGTKMTRGDANGDPSGSCVSGQPRAHLRACWTASRRCAESGQGPRDQSTILGATGLTRVVRWLVGASPRSERVLCPRSRHLSSGAAARPPHILVEC